MSRPEMFSDYVIPFLAALLGAGVGAGIALWTHRGQVQLQRRTALAQALGPLVSDLYEISRVAASEAAYDKASLRAARERFNQHSLAVLMLAPHENYDQLLRHFDEAGQQLMWWTSDRVTKRKKNDYIHALTTTLRKEDPTRLPDRLVALHSKFDGGAKWREVTDAPDPLQATYPTEEGRMQHRSNELNEKARVRLQRVLQLWCLALVGTPIIAGVVAFNAVETETGDYWLFPLLVLAVPSIGLLVATWGVLPPGGRWWQVRKWWRLATARAEQERQLKHIRTLAGVQGGLGLAFIATIGIFDPGPLELHMLTSTLVWVFPAIVYFVAFWGSARMEAG